MNPINQTTPPNIDARYRTMLTLWFGLFASVGMYFLFVMFAAPAFSNASESPPSTLFTIVITTLGTLSVLLSFVVKRKLLQLSVDRQEIALVQQALIVACVMCEVAAVLALVERFLFESHEYYLLFLISAIGIALHFPRRAQLLSATFKSSWKGAAS
jgi:lysylphosphatidylglycerol synthetase-like protein (DUF2156 family)